MNKRQYKTGVTLIEMLIVIAVLAVLMTMVVTVTRHVSSRSEIELTKGTLSIVTAALGEFADYGYHYTDGAEDYSQFKFPLDCNDFSAGDIGLTLKDALSDNVVTIDGADHSPEYSGSEILYFFLNSVPASRKTLSKIDSSLISSGGLEITITRGSGDRTYPLYRIMDPWGKALHYDYYDEDDPKPDEARTFPVVTSAGPDGKFGTRDDISNR